ncbi:Pseudo ankyrin repeat-like [Cedratvirus A11]|uniref:Pseudo ankyrin repeat-like n=1 Tax=Cedratvirus A11 TaxID=1903266 RepID=A0A1M7XV96_9VIRU|nr:Pseudo ankyrin repeat-like [Cedratvirus A11]SHO33500.1 Pseudo ankyrin repeat-like [Cedratvirus A11]
MNHIYKIIFSFSEGYNFLNGQVCFEFRQLVPKVDYLEYLDQLCKDGRTTQVPPLTKKTVKLAIDRDLLDLLQSCMDFVPEKFICNMAAEKGSLKVLQWARTKGYPWNARTCALAARCGHLEILQWARTNECIWDEEVCASAAEGGHLEILQWLRTNGCPWYNWICVTMANLQGHRHVSDWIKKN